MKKNSSKNHCNPNINTEKVREDDSVDLEANDDLYFSGDDERLSRKMAARRKIDLYMEKKRLKEELGLDDLFDDEFDL